MTQTQFLKEPRTVSVLGVDFSGGQPKEGVDEGPFQMIQFGILDQIKELDWRVEFDGSFPNYKKLIPTVDPDIGTMKKPRAVSNVTRALAQNIQGQAEKGHLALSLGGDHSIAIGTISGTAAVYDNLCVIWVDAHADINPVAESPSGNLHGCPLSFLIDGINGEVPEFEWVKPCLTPDRLVYIGLRDVDIAEKRVIKKLGIKAFSMHDVDKYGIGKVVEMAINHVNPHRNRPIHLSFDVDALDPTVAPSTGTPVRGGLTFREGHYICEAVAETGLLVAMDMVEVNPALGDDDSLLQTVTVGCSLVRCALGETLL
ncbi:Arginase, catabolizes arginine to ornithine and urea [Dimargaris cristalligena]|uniref:Arginase n=2 Tax=Zoopagomycota TaxID=1913638 RepID=A0A4Q0A3K1_9FUNG|nr:Arginase, catabolizes arginine to ornithine and urea [Dimargaris cristalligena]RKP25054.1 Ureohydrolase [Syncephalis pseudoplumigaleata]RKP39840.1 Ureohydrolase [Dimargaris cristalligena]|eukprot:RKP25054.1 Ureohydrolase [Syncephalis pseudoplumigaleata]